MTNSGPEEPAGWFATPAEELDVVRVQRVCNRLHDDRELRARRDNVRVRSLWRRLLAHARRSHGA